MLKTNTASKRHARVEVQQLIDLVNSVPAQLDLPAPEGRVEEIVELLRTEPFRRFRDLTGPVEPDTFLTKFVGAEAPKTFNKVLQSYIQLRDGRGWLRQAARIGELSPRVRMRWLMPQVSAQTNERGELEFNIPSLITALEGVEAIRIRICPICGLIFWAARRDKPACTIRCAKIRRTRLWRENYKQKHRHQRRKKSRARRALEEQREREMLAQLRAPQRSGNTRAVRLAVFQARRSGKPESSEKP